jgi:Flp pilus assembly protein TadG
MWSLDPMMVSPMHKIALRARALLDDCRGVVAIEFAVIAPVMLVMYFGMEEFSSGLAVNRQVTLVARTLSDLTSQSPSVADADLSNFGQTAKAILTPNDPSILKSSITEIYIDPKTHVARVQWSRALAIDKSGNVTVGASAYTVSQIVVVPPELNTDGTYLIWSEVSYNYKPTIGYVMAKAGVNLSDFAYTRPRQTACVLYPTPAPGAIPPACPTA